MRINSVISALLLACVASTAYASDSEAVQIRPVPHDSKITQADLQILAHGAGLQFEYYDYKVDRYHCVHFSVEISENEGEPAVSDGVGLCEKDGPHRITVQWRENEQNVSLYFYLHHREQAFRGGVSGPTFETFSGPGPRRASSGGLRAPVEFTFYEPKELTWREYTADTRDEETGKMVTTSEKRIVVYVELRENPEKTIGTE